MVEVNGLVLLNTAIMRLIKQVKKHLVKEKTFILKYIAH